MHILILGSGGREHAFAWKISQSPLCKKLFIAPGNPGTALHGQNVEISVNDFDKIKQFCQHEKIDIMLVGPEDPLVNGIYDSFQEDENLRHMNIIGPSQKGAMLEGSKAFAKEFMMKYKIPTASYKEFSTANFEEGLLYIESHSLPIVLKADGLAAGKGVVIAQTYEEASTEFTEMIQKNKFGKAGNKVVVEEFLSGIECSVFILTDGKNYILLPSAKDYKRIGEGDSGLNTGGMGAISPVPFADETFMNKVTDRIILPTMKGIQEENMRYNGFVFIGLISVKSEPYVIEYNCRMGDPETEVVLPRLENDLVDIFQKLHDGKLHEIHCQHKAQCAATIMLVKVIPNIIKRGLKFLLLNMYMTVLFFMPEQKYKMKDW
jgi:phosphoribosylamine--glycine ligase